MYVTTYSNCNIIIYGATYSNYDVGFRQLQLQKQMGMGEEREREIKE